MARDIEFLAAPQPDAEEPLDHEPPPRRLTPLAWVALVAVIAAVAVWIASRPTGTQRPAAGPTRTVTESPTSTRSSSPTYGSVQRICTAGAPVNGQLRMIAERRLTGLTVMPGQSFRCTTGGGTRHQVASESLAVRYRSVIVEIQASRRVGDSGQYLPTPSARGIARLVSAESQSAGLNVTVEVFGRAGTRTDPVKYSNLASDVSLQLVL